MRAVLIMATIVCSVSLPVGPHSFRARPTGVHQNDCNATITNPADVYAPGPALSVRVAVHVLHDGDTGRVSEECVKDGIRSMNSYFSGAHCAAATGIGLHLANLTYHNNATWQRNVTEASAWITKDFDATIYANIYLGNDTAAVANTAFPYPLLDVYPQPVVYPTDGISIAFNVWGPFKGGKEVCPLAGQGVQPEFRSLYGGYTAAHEMGHFLGLFHTFQFNNSTEQNQDWIQKKNVCLSNTAPMCNRGGDLICDTPSVSTLLDSYLFSYPEDLPFNWYGRVSNCTIPNSTYWCHDRAPLVSNAMGYAPDACITGFTDEQAKRMRCTLMTWREGILMHK